MRRTTRQEPHTHRKRSEYQVGVVVEFDGIDPPRQRTDDHRAQNGGKGHHGEKQRSVRRAALKHVGDEVHVPAAANVENVDQQKRHHQHQQQLIVFPQARQVLAQGEFTHQRKRDALAHPEEAAQEHHHGDGAQHADAQLITPGGIALSQL